MTRVLHFEFRVDEINKIIVEIQFRHIDSIFCTNSYFTTSTTLSLSLSLTLSLSLLLSLSLSLSHTHSLSLSLSLSIYLSIFLSFLLSFSLSLGVGRPAKALHQLYTNTRCFLEDIGNLEDLPVAMDDRDRWRE